MDIDEFWGLIEDARGAAGDDPDEVAEVLVDRLASGPEQRILEFSRFQDDLLDHSYRWDLWGAAYLINDGCSDDGFDYFRGWLMAQGRAVWETVLAEPDSLAVLPAVRVVAEQEDGDILEGEAMLSVAEDAYAERTGDEEAFWEAAEAAEKAGEEVRTSAGAGSPGEESMGEEFDFDDDAEMRARFPRLTTLFLGPDEE